MPSLVTTCPKCGRGMEPGYIPDNANNRFSVAQWWAGIPRKSFWFGLRKPDEPPIPIAVCRCPGCGFLECYAKPEFAAG